jgi:hypothetical protein
VNSTVEQFTALYKQDNLDAMGHTRLRRTLTDQLDEHDPHAAVDGCNPSRDLSLPSLGTGSPA